MRRMLLLMLLVSFLPMLVAVGVVFIHWSLNTRKAQAQANLDMAQAVAYMVEQKIQEIAIQAHILAQTISTLDAFHQDRMNTILMVSAMEHPMVLSIFWTDSEGRFIAGSDASRIGEDVSDSAFFNTLREGRDWTIGRYVPGNSGDGSPALVLSHALSWEDQEFPGALLVFIDPTCLIESAFDMRNSLHGQIHILDREGFVIESRPSRDLIGKHLHMGISFPHPSQKPESSIISIVNQDRREMAAWVRTPVSHLTILTTRSYAEVMAPVYHSLAQVVAWIAVVFVLSLIVYGLLSERIIRSLRRLQDHAQALGRGDLSRRAPPKGVTELAELSDHLNMMAERIHDREEKLDQALQRLERSNEELERFAYVASHDLQEPLRMVGGFLQLLQRRYHNQLDPEADEYIEFAVNGATRMKALISDLLVFSRLHTRPRQFLNLDSQRILDAVAENLHESLAETGGALTHDPMPEVMGDMTLLIQLFQNLIANALKFRKEDAAPRIHISVTPRDGEWLFAVQDNGIGMEPQYYERIFVIFQRLHDSTRYPGTGLGLAICRKVVDLHGGQIWVESELGRGSTFYFTLPQASGE